MTPRLHHHPFSLRQLQYVVAVADLQSFRRAAERCAVSQPSLSAQVAEVESLLGVQLFERDKRGVRLTPAGEAIVREARAVLLAADALGETARRFIDPLQSVLRLGVIPTLAAYLLPRATPALLGAHPKLMVLWAEHPTATLVERVTRGDLDGAVLALEAELGTLAWTALGEDPFLAALPPGHPLAHGERPLTLDELEGERLLLLDEGHCLRQQVLAWCGRSLPEELAFRATSLPTLVQMVAAGAGITLLPRIAVATETARSGVAVRRLAPPPSRTIVLAWRASSPLGAAFATLARTLAMAVTEREPA
jgi:LysR family hydrogen peroxide-inducible transcriptional activator